MDLCLVEVGAPSRQPAPEVADLTCDLSSSLRAGPPVTTSRHRSHLQPGLQSQSNDLQTLLSYQS